MKRLTLGMCILLSLQGVACDGGGPIGTLEPGAGAGRSIPPPSDDGDHLGETPPPTPTQPPPTQPPPTQPPPTQPPPTQPPPTQPPPSLGLAGTWALRLASAQVMNFPLAGEQATRVSMFARVLLSEQADGLNLKLEVCDVDVVSDGNVQLTFPPAAATAFPPADIDVKIADGALSSPPVVQLVGWLSNTPTTDTMPTRRRDNRVVDGDNDGNPGITVGMKMGAVNADLAVVLRAAVQLGAIQNLTDNAIEGLMTMKLEQSVVDVMGGGLLGGFIPTGEVATTADPDPAKSTFKVVRVDAAATCASVKAAKTTLFP